MKKKLFNIGIYKNVYSCSEASQRKELNIGYIPVEISRTGERIYERRIFVVERTALLSTCRLT